MQISPLIVLALVLTAWSCGQKESRITNARLQETDAAREEPARSPMPLMIDAVELESSNHPDAGPRDWVGCVGGALQWDGGTVKACREKPRAWVDPARDEVVFVITAAHARKARAEVAGTKVEAPFVAGKARLVVALEAAYTRVSATTVAETTPLEVAIEIDHEGGVAKGRLALVTTRVMRLIEAGAIPTDADARGVLFVGPEPDRLPPNPDRPIASFERIAVDIGAPRLTLPCPARDDGPAAISAGRWVRPVHLKIFSRGRTLGERELGDDACDAAPVRPEDVLHAVDDPRPATPERADGVPKDPMGLLRLTRFIGLTPKTRPEDAARILGPIDAPSGPIGARFLHGHLSEVRIAGRAGVDILKTKNLDDPLFSLIDQPVSAAIAELGRPTLSGRGFLTWTVDQGPLTIYVELRCEARCHTLRVGYMEGVDPHDGGDVPGAQPHPHSHRHPNDHPHPSPDETP